MCILQIHRVSNLIAWSGSKIRPPHTTVPLLVFQTNIQLPLGRPSDSVSVFVIAGTYSDSVSVFVIAGTYSDSLSVFVIAGTYSDSSNL